MNLDLAIPDELYARMSELADRQHVSVQRMAVAAIAEQLAGWNRVEAMAMMGNRDRYLAALDRVPAGEPDPQDRFADPGSAPLGK